MRQDLVIGGVAAGAVALAAGAVGVGWWFGLGDELAMLTRGRISPHFTEAELTVSATADQLGLDNTPTDKARRALRYLATEALEPIRAFHGGPLRVNSAYRSPAVNAAVGGVPSSYHKRGLAADFEPIHGSARELFDRILASGLLDDLPIDQLFYYPTRGHIHVGVRAKNPRREAGIKREGAPVEWLV